MKGKWKLTREIAFMASFGIERVVWSVTPARTVAILVVLRTDASTEYNMERKAKNMDEDLILAMG